jgi:hypothetical protein
MAEAQVLEAKQAGNVVTSENLTEWNMNRLGLAGEDAPIEADAVEETPESEPIADDEQSEQESEPEGKATEERKQNPKLEKRFSELTKARKQAEENAAKAQAEKEQLEARLREYEDRQAPQPQVEESPIGREPRADQFDDAFEYAKALAEWSAEKALYDRDQQDLNRKIEEERQRTLKTWSEKLQKAKPNLADFDEIVNSTQVVVSNEVRDAIVESDVGPEILYHLASLDAEEAEKFQALPISKALREIGKLEARFEKQEAAQEEAVRSKPVAQKSKAPAPLSPIKATGSAMETPIGSDGEFHGSFQAWKAARKAGKIR